MVRYFKKYDPRVILRTGRGSTVPFIDIGGQWGLLATTDGYLIGELKKCQDEVRGGVAEITKAEFDELKKKENQIPFPVWREAIEPRKLRALKNGHLAASVAAGKAALPFEVTGFSEAKALGRPAAKSDYVPKTVDR
jgi:hypothetical protein